MPVVVEVALTRQRLAPVVQVGVVMAVVLAMVLPEPLTQVEVVEGQVAQVPVLQEPVAQVS
jgi:hypothetical protein